LPRFFHAQVVEDFSQHSENAVGHSIRFIGAAGMARVFLSAVFTFLIAATTAKAAVTLTGSNTLPTILSDGPQPWSSTFQLNQGIQASQITIAEFTMPTSSASTTFEITEANVEQFGETWDNVLNWTDGLVRIPSWTHRVVNWTHNGLEDGNVGQSVASRMTDPFLVGDSDIGSFTPTSFKIEYVHHEQELFNPAVSQVRWTISGTGTLIPEPTSAVLFLFGLLGIAVRRVR
jgi:hypothetical protein